MKKLAILMLIGLINLQFPAAVSAQPQGQGMSPGWSGCMTPKPWRP